jgi:hypothetical protein
MNFNKYLDKILNESFQKINYGYNSYGSKWTPLIKIKELEVNERGNEWFDDTKLDLDKTMAIWVDEDPRSSVLYNLSGDFRDIVDEYNPLPKKVPKGYTMDQDEYENEREIFLSAIDNVIKVYVTDAIPVIEHDEPFGKAYLYIKPVYKIK